MTEIKLDSYCRQKVAMHAKVQLGALLFFGACVYFLGCFSVLLFVISFVDRPYDVNSPIARLVVAIIVFVVFILVLFPFVNSIRKRHTNRADYYDHINRFYTTVTYSLHIKVSGGRSQATYYYADIQFHDEVKRLQFLNERHWKYLEQNPGRELLFVTSESGELRDQCMAYDMIHSKEGKTGNLIFNIFTIFFSLVIAIWATVYCINSITETLQYLP